MNFIKYMSRYWAVPAFTSGLCLIAQAPSQALQFNFSYEKGTPYQQMLGFEVAGGVWSALLTDDVTVNIHVGASGNLPKGVVGGALPGMQVEQSYSNYYSKIVKDRDDVFWHDRHVLTHSFQKHKNGGDRYYKGQLENSVQNIYGISLTNANAKAAGMINPHSTALDGTIMMSDLKGTGYNWNYDFDRSGGIGNKSLDFLSVAIHEVGHVLGFVSSLDLVTKKEQQLTNDQVQARINRTTPLDLFRTSDSTNSNAVELRAGAASYLSLDSGKSKVADFARGAKDIGNGSDGYQASHWKQKPDGGNSGMMGPAIRGGERRNVGWSERVALDVIGWDLNSSSKHYDLNLLEDQAREKIANRLGTSVSWLNSHKGAAASQLSSTNTTLLANMAAESDSYYQLFGASALGSAGWWQLFQDLGYAGWWQEYIANDAYGQKAYFSTLEAPSETQDVPEPTSLLGFISLAVFGFMGQQCTKRQD